MLYIWNWLQLFACSCDAVRELEASWEMWDLRMYWRSSRDGSEGSYLDSILLLSSRIRRSLASGTVSSRGSTSVMMRPMVAPESTTSRYARGRHESDAWGYSRGIAGYQCHDAIATSGLVKHTRNCPASLFHLQSCLSATPFYPAAC